MRRVAQIEFWISPSFPFWGEVVDALGGLGSLGKTNKASNNFARFSMPRSFSRSLGCDPIYVYPICKALLESSSATLRDVRVSSAAPGFVHPHGRFRVSKAPTRPINFLIHGSVPRCGVVSCIPTCWNQQTNHVWALAAIKVSAKRQPLRGPEPDMNPDRFSTLATHRPHLLSWACGSVRGCPPRSPAHECLKTVDDP